MSRCVYCHGQGSVQTCLVCMYSMWDDMVQISRQPSLRQGDQAGDFILSRRATSADNVCVAKHLSCPLERVSCYRCRAKWYRLLLQPQSLNHLYILWNAKFSPWLRHHTLLQATHDSFSRIVSS